MDTKYISLNDLNEFQKEFRSKSTGKEDEVKFMEFIQSRALETSILPRNIVKECKENLINQQVKLVGSPAIYDYVRNFTCFAPPLFLKEQFALFKWRFEFFEDYFPISSTWIKEHTGREDSIEYHITGPERFDKIMDLACKYMGPATELVYFELLRACALEEGDKLRDNFNRMDDEDVDTSFQVNNYGQRGWLNFSQCVHILISFFSNGPSSLLEISMKKVMSLRLNTSTLPKELQVMQRSGVYCWNADGAPPTPKCLNGKGKDIYRRLVANYQEVPQFCQESYEPSFDVYESDPCCGCGEHF